MVQDSFSTYRLRADALEEYLRKVFPEHADFKVKLSADGREFYTFDVPQPLTKTQRDEIEDKVRWKPPSEDEAFL
ncbi:hypothetical protein MFIFM68171_09663 [Madurella fahalii]|uniref:Uncharacterized protein n=1 Tax=Madurella fahalii TaxID=1157608 RepID=A0ABQ0GNZ6_9PEZI